MDEPIEHLYFSWLCAKVLPLGNPTHLDLMKILYSTEFSWLLAGDENRVDDGLELRTYFLNQSGLETDSVWESSRCSVLEVLIAFSDRASFQTDIPAHAWFWEFLSNLNLSEYRQVEESDHEEIEQILYVFIWRMYDEDGYGGLFPLQEPKHDQRKVEIWYQFCEYLEDQDRL